MPAFDYQRLYDRMAPFYAPAMRLLPVWRRYTEAILPWLPADGRILEVGPGPGVLHARLATPTRMAVGLDLSTGMLKQARKRVPLARLICGNAVNLPFAARSFDAVAMTFVFSAIPDGQQAMREFARLLQSGGILALVDAGIPSNGNRPGRWLAAAWERFGDFMRDEAALMRQAGFEIVEQREFGAFNSIRLAIGRKP
ncbi:MAG: methyltransferase domain-containing protein [Caldilineales bacterium]|nr:methyltransferase domain-containing protein [Caldilineales bacterium]